MTGIATLVLLAAVAQGGRTQISPVHVFASEVRASTARYQDQAEAVKDGYRKIGPDFPSMGEHWLNRAIVMQGEIDPQRPPILEYITVNGRPVLAGVAYARLAYGEPPVTGIPAPRSAWHYHAGSVDEESFIASHAAHGAADTTRGPRIAVLHAWLWADNPAGLFATDNWALPWLRLGVEPPGPSPGPDSLTMMAALAAGGEHYFTTLLRVQHHLDEPTTARVAALLKSYHAQLWSHDDQITLRAVGWGELQEKLRAICEGCGLPEQGH
jgi:hypothetical protein